MLAAGVHRGADVVVSFFTKHHTGTGRRHHLHGRHKKTIRESLQRVGHPGHTLVIALCAAFYAYFW
jgi:hypothetical protein